LQRPAKVVSRFFRQQVARYLGWVRLGSRYRSGRSPDWLKMKNPAA
jgi:hypothetical protein